MFAGRTGGTTAFRLPHPVHPRLPPFLRAHKGKAKPTRRNEDGLQFRWLRTLFLPPGLVPVDAHTRVPWPEGEMVKTWWFAARRPWGLPSARDIDLKRLKTALPRLLLHDVEPGRPVFRIRLAGEEYAAMLGRNPKDLTFAQLPVSRALRRRYMWAVRHRQPYYTRPLELTWAERPYRRYQSLVMPLSSDGGRVDAVLALGRFFLPEEEG